MIKKWFKMRSKRKSITTEEPVKGMNANASSSEFLDRSPAVSRVAALARYCGRLSVTNCIASSLPCLARFPNHGKESFRTYCSRTLSRDAQSRPSCCYLRRWQSALWSQGSFMTEFLWLWRALTVSATPFSQIFSSRHCSSAYFASLNLVWRTWIDSV